MSQCNHREYYNVASFRRNRREVRSVPPEKLLEHCKKFITIYDTEDRLNEMQLCILIELSTVDLDKIVDYVHFNIWSIGNRIHGFECIVSDSICRLFVSHNVNLMPLRGLKWWNNKSLWKSEVYKDLVKKDINISSAEAHLDTIERSCSGDVHVAVMLIGLRKYRLSINIIQYPREIILIIAKMVYLKSLEAAWERLRVETDEEVNLGRQKWIDSVSGGV